MCPGEVKCGQVDSGAVTRDLVGSGAARWGKWGQMQSQVWPHIVRYVQVYPGRVRCTYIGSGVVRCGLQTPLYWIYTNTSLDQNRSLQRPHIAGRNEMESPTHAPKAEHKPAPIPGECGSSHHNLKQMCYPQTNGSPSGTSLME